MDLQQQEKLDLWRSRIQECKESGLSIIDWCSRNGFSKYTYYYWNSRIKMNNQEMETAPVFIEIPQVVSEPEAAPSLEQVHDKDQMEEKRGSLCISYNGVRITCGTAQEAQLAAEFIGRLQLLCSSPL